TEDEAPPPPPPAPVPMADLMRAVATPAPAPVPDMPVLEEGEQEEIRRAILAEIGSEDSRAPLATIFQDYGVRCRMRGVEPGIDLPDFRSALALARVGITDRTGWDDALTPPCPRKCSPPSSASPRPHAPASPARPTRASPRSTAPARSAAPSG
ncbi:MAG: hypothetical protein ACK4GG_14230, partial [Sphingomonas sp.]